MQVCKKIGFEGCFCVDSHGTGGGLALMWKKDCDIIIRESCYHYIDFEVNIEQIGKWRYTGYYGCPERERRQESWDMLRYLAAQSNMPWCIIGDFNDIMFAEEKYGRVGHPRRLLEGFTQAVNDCQLHDLGFKGSTFTWERSRGSERWVQERLDRGLANQYWRDMFPAAEITVLDISTSDHLPLSLQLNRKIYVPKNHRFRFENMWVKEKDCLPIIQNCWLEMAGRDIAEKIEYCCLKLEEWGGGIMKEYKVQIREHKAKLRKLRSRRDTEGINQYNETRWAYLKLLEKQEIYWHQRAKQFWLQHGDQNTRFFHQYASNRRKNNTVQGLNDDQGVWTEKEEEVQDIIIKYYEKLFTTAIEAGGNLTARDRVAQVTHEQNEELMKRVTAEEVKEATFSMHPEKSPGIDGLNPGFFQVFWNIVGSDVIEFCQRVFDTGEMPISSNRTLICLIPKVKQPKQMTELRPISLCNVLVRIVSKVLANRLKPCLNSIISDKQSAFIEGRLLTDNALLAYEINHCMKRRTQGKKGIAGLKLDISKAYDRLEWRYIEGMMGKFGFSNGWIQRVMATVKSVTYSFVNNGRIFGDIRPSRGIRQGDPISPYIYILCAEGLSSMLRRNEEAGLIHGVAIARGAPQISHLLFADDCYLFFRASDVEARTVKTILARYEKLSGQAINFNKSSVTFSPNTNVQERYDVCQELQVREVREPGKYLGMPMNIGKKKVSTFQFLTDRVKHKLQAWGTRMISKAGKCTLLKTAAQSVPHFWMNLFLIPDEVCTSIETLMNGFWWEHGQGKRGIRWKAWSKMCTAKTAGGLGFRKFKEFNISMLAKQGWRLVNNDNPLVTMCMKAKYFPRGDFLTAKLGANPSYMWRSLLSAQEVLTKGCRRRIGGGQQTEIWKVPWLPCVQNGFMTTEMPTQLEGSKICSLMQIGQQQWDEEVLADICNARDRNLIRKIPLPREGGNDSWFWLLDDKGIFTVRSCYRQIVGEIETPDKLFWNKLWSLKLPGKVAHFLWRVCSLCLPTADRLNSKGVHIDKVCQWCRLHDETDIHVLFECEIAKETWTLSGLQNNIIVDQGDNSLEVIRRGFDRCTKEQCTLFAVLCWSLWNRRNKWLWERINISVFGVKASADFMLTEWRKAQEQRMVSSTHVAGTLSVKKWERPRDGWVKINIDAGIFENIECIGLGSIARGADGQFFMARSVKRGGLLNPREAEAMCLKEALSWAVSKGWKKCVFETDSQVLSRACKGVRGKSYFDTIVNDCIESFKHFDEVLVCYVHRSANRAAHALAREACSLTDYQEWCDSIPEFLYHVISTESL